jgi:hypothetical protein
VNRNGSSLEKNAKQCAGVIVIILHRSICYLLHFAKKTAKPKLFEEQLTKKDIYQPQMFAGYGVRMLKNPMDMKKILRTQD